jgi:release factor glutamine methyltransferase
MARLNKSRPRYSMRDLLNDAAATLHEAGIADARLDAELMLARAAGVSRVRVITQNVEIGEAERVAYAALVGRRVAREPLAYILGCKEFYSIKLEVTPAVLIPRPETETVVAAALEEIAERPISRILDLGTGSGAIALAIGSNAPQVTIVASDISDRALAVAARNAKRLGLERRINFLKADCSDVMGDPASLGCFDLIVSNPPYIKDSEIVALKPEIVRWEPHLALAGGPDGLSFFRHIARFAPNHLNPEGRLIVEIGDGQYDRITEIFRAVGFLYATRLHDFSGMVRVLVARRFE